VIRPRRSRPSLETAKRLATSLDSLLRGRAIDRVWRPQHAQLLIRFSGRDKRRLWIDLDDDRPRWILTHDWPENPDRPDDQTLRLRSVLEGWRITEVALRDERALDLHLQRGEERHSLRLQMAGRYLNICVEGSDLESDIALLLDRPGADDDSPPLKPSATAGDDLDVDDWLSSLADRWSSESAWLVFFREQAELRRLLRESRKRVDRALGKIGRDLARAQGAEENRRKGDMIKTMLGRVPPGATEIEAIDYNDPACPRLSVPLDPAYDAVTNMKRYYRLYRRFNDARQDIEARHSQAARRLSDLDSLLEELEAIESDAPESARASVHACRERAAKLGVRAKVAQTQGQRTVAAALPYRTFSSSNGNRILVGRSAKDNDALTFRVARGRDIWLHARDVAGSHVMIPLERGAEPSQETLMDAAHLALHFSQARGEPAGDVQWTERKNLRRVPGAGSGRVTVAASRTLRVSFDTKRLETLYERRSATPQ
jgi:predicted ribosome quality control (RQC) complex YloA/Tae2 family protein